MRRPSSSTSCRRILQVERYEFEGWLATDLARLAGCVDRLLERCGVVPGDVDRVFSPADRRWCPCVRRLFERFGVDRLRSGNERSPPWRAVSR